MRKLFLTGSAVLSLVLTGGIAVCSSSSSAAIAAAAGRKTAFCAGNLKIDKASSNVNSNAGFLTVLKHNKSALSTMENNLPSGKLGAEAQKEIAAAAVAIASGSVNELNTAPHRRVGISTRIAESTETGIVCLHTSQLAREAASAQPSSQYIEQSETPTVLLRPWPLWRPTRLKSPSSLPRSRRCPPQSKPRPVRR